jgi:FSR family fosmidomycin resistance protein-like MFS transporter
MNNGPLLLFLLSFGHLCTDLVQGALPALLPYLKDRFTLSYAATGTILLAAHLTSSMIQPLFGYVTDRRPFPVLLSLGCLISGIGIALLPHSPTFPWLIAIVTFLGIGTAAFHPEGFKATACIASVKRATGMSFFSVGGNLGFAIGAPAAIFLVSRYGLPGASALFVPAAVAAALFVPALTPIRERIAAVATRPLAPVDNGVRHPVYAVTLIVLIVVFRTWTQLGIAAFLPFLYREELTSNPGFVATLLFLFLGAGAVGTLAGGPIADRIGHRRMLFLSLALQVPLISLFLSARGWAVFPLAAAVGATIVSTFSVTIVMAQELFPRRMATASPPQEPSRDSPSVREGSA